MELPIITLNPCAHYTSVRISSRNSVYAYPVIARSTASWQSRSPTYFFTTPNYPPRKILIITLNLCSAPYVAKGAVGDCRLRDCRPLANFNFSESAFPHSTLQTQHLHRKVLLKFRLKKPVAPKHNKNQTLKLTSF